MASTLFSGEFMTFVAASHPVGRVQIIGGEMITDLGVFAQRRFDDNCVIAIIG